MGASRAINAYESILIWVFNHHYSPGDTQVRWERSDLDKAADALNLPRVKNLGDIPYSFRYRRDIPAAIAECAPEGMEWIIRGAGDSKYRFDGIPKQKPIAPDPALPVTKIPDATPQIITSVALEDEQALLAKVRYNRLIDLFLGVTAYSLQNHLRTKVKDIGQVEIDEIYAAIDRHGRQFIIPVQAKGGKDRLGITQIEQDIEACKHKWPQLICRPISVQFANDRIALFDVTVEDNQVKILQESHYLLVHADLISAQDLEGYVLNSNPDWH